MISTEALTASIYPGKPDAAAMVSSERQKTVVVAAGAMERRHQLMLSFLLTSMAESLSKANLHEENVINYG
jgi:hypothetical protein